jgi:hypothetical protein
MAAERNAPGMVGVFFSAALSFVLGALLALFHLAAQPVEVLRTAPKEAPPPGTNQMILGTPGSTAGKAWERKRSALDGGVVSFTEAELNAWSEATFEPAKIEEDKKASTVVILAGVPNFRIDGSKLHVGLVNTLYFFGSEAPVVLHGRGEFVKGGSGWRFEPDQAYLGGLPLHRLPALVPLVASRFGAGQVPAEADKVMRQATEIALRDGALVITMP